MRIFRPAAERGHSAIGWLDSWHTFSFSDYLDEAWMGFRALRVINDDVIQPGQGFPTHPHRDMEILTWVVEGRLEHRDSTGGGGIVSHGEVQGMTAGRGIRHSEFNASATEPVRLLQIWIEPDRRGETPRYAQAAVPASERHGRWAVVAAGPGRASALPIRADAAMLVASLEPGMRLDHHLAPGRHAWVQIASGTVDVDGRLMAQGDGLALSDETGLAFTARSACEILLFDLV